MHFFFKSEKFYYVIYFMVLSKQHFVSCLAVFGNVFRSFCGNCFSLILEN